MAGNSFAREIKGMSNTLYLTVTEFFQKCNSLPHNVAVESQSTINEKKACGVLPSVCTSAHSNGDS